MNNATGENSKSKKCAIFKKMEQDSKFIEGYHLQRDLSQENIQKMFESRIYENQINLFISVV